MAADLDAMVARHLAGEPLAYVLGHWSFRHLDLAVDRRVLIPRPETEVVAGVALELARGLARPLTVADLGTGSGAIGLALADELPLDGVTVWLTDASADAIDVARANLAGLGRRGRNVRIAIGSWFDALPAGTTLDLAVANPPYVADDSPDVEAARARVGAADGAVRRAGRARRGPRRSSATPRDGSARVAGSSSRSAPTRAPPSPICSTPRVTRRSRSDPTSPAATASPSPGCPDPPIWGRSVADVDTHRCAIAMDRLLKELYRGVRGPRRSRRGNVGVECSFSSMLAELVGLVIWRAAENSALRKIAE